MGELVKFILICRKKISKEKRKKKKKFKKSKSKILVGKGGGLFIDHLSEIFIMLENTNKIRRMETLIR